MAAELSVGTTQHSYEDVFLATKAERCAAAATSHLPI